METGKMELREAVIRTIAMPSDTTRQATFSADG